MGGLIGGLYKLSTIILDEIKVNGTMHCESTTLTYKYHASSLLGMETSVSTINTTNVNVSMNMSGNQIISGFVGLVYNYSVFNMINSKSENTVESAAYSSACIGYSIDCDINLQNSTIIAAINTTASNATGFGISLNRSTINATNCSVSGYIYTAGNYAVSFFG